MAQDISNKNKEFNKTTVSWLVHEKRNLVAVNTKTSIQEALELMSKENILAIPIIDEHGKPLAIASIFDIMTYVAFGVFREDGSEPNLASLDQKLAHPVFGIVGSSEEGEKVWTYGPDTPLANVTEPMSKGVHRALVLHRIGANDVPIYRMLTQTDVIRHFLNFGEGFPETQKSLEQLGLASYAGKPTITIKATETALHGLRVMQNSDIPALPVVGDNGEILTTFSASDLRGLTPAQLINLQLPVIDFLKNQRGGRLTSPITCTPGDRLFPMMLRALAAQVHRLWVVDVQLRPIGVVSLSDMINVLRGIDEDLHSRQLAVYGKSAMQRLGVTNVLISGMNGVGAEIAKNVILAGIRSVTLHDTKDTIAADLGSHFYLRPDDIGKNRAEACLKRMKELNPAVKVYAVTTELDTQLLAQHSVVVLIDTPIGKSVEYNEFCRTQNPPINFIKVDANGLMVSLFTDFGDKFVVNDPTGENPGSNIISNIAPDGKITVVNSDDQISFGDGSYVIFKEVQGIEELNDGTPRKVHDVHPFSFRVEGINDYSGYITGGVVIECKMEKELNFRSYKDCLADPGLIEDTDYSKFGRANLLHAVYRALDAFREKNGRLPLPGNQEDGDAVVALTKEFNDAASFPVEVNEDVVRKLASGSSSVLNPSAASIGGIAGQEVIKAATGKFHPFFQFLYFDSLECLPNEPIPAEKLQPKNSRYDNLITVFGSDFVEKVLNLNYFLVGAGALGCEFLKNFAMSGVGCGPNGKVTVTDDDVIEKSNLSRQFLFRNWHIHKPKSACAASVAQQMNPDFHVQPMQERVATNTEKIFNEEFWNKLDGVCNALDNIKARLYVDSRCVFFEKPLLESGTLGPKCHTQVVLPHKTAHYGAKPDQEEKSTPACTLHNFPHNIDHCLQWGRSEFVGNFETAPDEVNKYYTNPNYVNDLQEADTGMPEITEKLRAIQDCLKFPTRSFDDCIAWARLRFEDYFTNRIKQLTYNFPKDAKTKEGTSFWAPPKRFPQPLIFNSSDEVHMQFIISASNLRANICGIEAPLADNQNRDPAYFRRVLANVHVPEFVPSHDRAIQEQVEKEGAKNEQPAAAPAPEDLEGIRAALPDHVDFTMKPEEFEKDNDANHHMDFIGSVGNLRARNYYIDEVEPLKAKLIAGRIIPAIATATALATGLVMFELYKIVNNKQVGADFTKVGDYRNSGNNLALPRLQFYDTDLPATHVDHVEVTVPDPVNHPDYQEEEEIVAYPPNWTIWDKLAIDVHENTTLQDILDIFDQKHGLEIDALAIQTQDGKKLQTFYANFLPNTKSRLSQTFKSVYETVMDGQSLEGRKYVLPDITLRNKDGLQVETPTIIFWLK